MTAIALALHVLAAVIWVGGMFTIYVCLRPALGVLETPPQRLSLAAATFAKFFPWVWMSILLLFVSGYFMVFVTFGGFANTGLHIHIMHGLAWIMTALFAWLYWGSWASLRVAVQGGDWESAGRALGQIRKIISINLPLGLIVAAIGASGRLWS